MTDNPFAALLADVPRYGVNVVSAKMERHPYGVYVELDRVLAALAAAVPADLAEAGKVLEGVTPGPWVEIHGDVFAPGQDLPVALVSIEAAPDARFIAWTREGVPALLARIAAQEATIKGLEAADRAQVEVIEKQADTIIRINARAEAAEAKVKGLMKGTVEASKMALDYIAKLEAAETALAAERARVAKLVEALGFYADENTYETQYERLPCDCCTAIYEPINNDKGAIARAAITEAGK